MIDWIKFDWIKFFSNYHQLHFMTHFLEMILFIKNFYLLHFKTCPIFSFVLIEFNLDLLIILIFKTSPLNFFSVIDNTFFFLCYLKCHHSKIKMIIILFH
jgi:hypothetical protein